MQSLVTDHAMLRWLERIEGVDIKQLRRDLSADGIVNPTFATMMWHVKAQHGFTRADIEAKILSPLVLDAMAAGLATLSLGGVTIGISGGRVVTVIVGKPRLPYLHTGKKKPAKKIAQEELSGRSASASKPWRKKFGAERRVFFRCVSRVKEMSRP